MNMLKRSLAMLLVLTLLFSFVPFSVFADDGESAETTAVTEAVEQRSGGPGNSDFGHSQGNGKDKHKHKDPLKETEAPEVTEAPTETTVPETTVPETTVPETTVPETTVPETTVPETTVPETTVPETTVPETTVPETTVPETTVPETTQETVPETTVETVSAEGLYALNTLDLEAEIATVADVDVQYRVLHLDNGRKYFSAAWIKALINEMAAAGYNQLQLAFGNDGLRFLLNDMSVTVNGTTYSSEAVTAGIQAGNTAYNASVNYAPSVNALTQAEMDDIIAHANSKGVAIVPHMNMPGHMDAILDAIEYVGISNAHFTGSTTSVRSLNLNNADAVAFAKALLQKYVDYFASKGCGFFHIGADEFANDAYGGSMGFPSMGAGLYTKFAAFVNDCAAIVKGKGMTPRAWNDGISYGEGNAYSTTNYSAAFDTGIQVTYWSSGWGYGYAVAPASTLRSKGHQMINTNGDYYFILTSNGITNPSGTALNFNNTSFMGSTIADPIGSMFCIWCDSPGFATEQETAAAARITLRKMAAAMKNSTNYSEKVVPGGFNADGTIHVVEPEQPEETEPTTPVEPTPVVDDATKVSVTAQNVTDIEVTPVTENLPTIEAAAEGKVVAFDVTPKTEDDTVYTGEATVSIPVSDEWTNVRGGVLASAHGGEVMGIEGDLKTDAQGNKTFTFAVPHFSTVFAYEVAPVDEGDLADTVVAGSGTAATFVLDKDGLDINAQYLIVSGTNALKNNKSSLTVTVSDDNATPSDDAAAALWTYTAEEYYGNHYNPRLSNGSDYLYTSVTGKYPNYQYNLIIDENDNTLTITSNNDGNYVVGRNSYGITVYVVYNNGWGAAAQSQALSFYKYTPGTQTFTVNAALQESRITALTVANDSYTDESWNAYQTALTEAKNKLAGVKGETYNSEAAANTALNELKTLVDALEIAKNALAKSVEITITYKTADGAVIKSETRRVSEKDTSITLSNFNHNDKFYVVNSATQSITPATVTEYTVTVTETAEDLSQVTPLTIEYYITNQRVTIDGVTQKSLTAEAVYGEDGVAFVDLVPASDNAENPKVFWKGWLLPEGYHQGDAVAQSLDMCTDTHGKFIQKLRYWDGKWAFHNGTEWVDIVTGDQLVAYYLQRTNITDEVTTNVTDWGETYKTWSELNGQPHWFFDGYVKNGSKYVFMDFAVVYEDGTQTPNAFPVDDTWFFHFDGCSATNPRVLKPISFDETGDYEIWKITVTEGTSSGYASASTFASAYNNTTETIVWTEAMGGTPHIDSLTYTANRSGKLIRIYVKAVTKEDSLKVVYYDEKFGDTLVEYNVIVPDGITFNNGIVKANTKTPATLPEFNSNAERKDATGYGIVNALDKTQNFRTDLTQVPEAVGKYNNGLYTYTGSVISEDGLTITHYYTINTNTLSPNFVADFGLPLSFPLTQVIGENQESLVESVSVNEKTKYGTLSYNATSKTFTYTPTRILENIDVLSINIKFKTKEEATLTNVGVTPATTVYYEESFLTYDSNWRVGAAPTKTQKTEVLGNSTYYGYDDAYNGVNNPADRAGSNGTQAVSQTNGATASFTFTGTGFELYANSKPASGIVTVYSEGNVSKLYMIDTALTPGDSAATNQQNGGTYYSLPIISENSLPHGTYTVQLRQTNGDEVIYIDGVRVINTLHPDTTIVVKKDGQDVTQNIYLADEEDYPAFYELRDYVLNALTITDTTSKDYGTLQQMKNQVYAGISNNGEAPANAAVVLSNKAEINAQDLLDNGPKNELYLYPGTSLTFSFKTDRVAQLGLKAPVGNATFTVKETVNDETETLDLRSLSTTVDMFYKIADKGAASNGMTVTISVSDGVLSVTDLKICDDPNAALLPLTLADIENTLVNVYGFSNEETPVEPPVPETPTEPSKPVEPTEPEKPTEPEVEETKPTKPGKPEKPEKPEKPAKPGQNKPGKPAEKQKDAKLKITYVNLLGKKVGSATLTKTGTANQRCTFSASEIIGNAPARRNALWFLPVVSAYGSNVSIIVPVI